MQFPGPPPMPTLRVIDPRRMRRQRLLVLAAWLATVLAAYLIGRYVMIPDADGLSAELAQAQATLSELRQRLDETEQRLANVERAEQIARLANENVQAALGGKDTEIANLRHDLSLYNRLIGPEAVRQGLTVYELALAPAADGSVAFSAVLTQTQDVRQGSEGRLTLSVEGQRGGALERIDWPALAAPGEVEGLPYDFRYFQRIEGRFILPKDFQPHSVRVRLRGRGGETVERSLRWDQVADSEQTQGSS